MLPARTPLAAKNENVVFTKMSDVSLIDKENTVSDGGEETKLLFKFSRFASLKWAGCCSII